MSSILVVTEVRDGQLKPINHEVFTAALKLGNSKNLSVTALILGTDVNELTDEPGKYGVKQVIVASDSKLAKYSPDCFAAAVVEIAKQKNPEIILMGATNMGKDLLARVAQALNTTLAQDVTAIRVEGDEIIYTRPMYAGKVTAEVTISSFPQMATIRPKSYKAEENPTSVAVETVNIELPEPLVVVDEVIKSTGGKQDVTEADIIISGGRGMKGPENWHLIEKLAEVTGAATGCSRPVSDEGWRDHGEHIGQTGKTVSPTLYVACGISGAIQHLAGISSSKCIVAINKDPEAPIFKAADYGIVGDIFEVLPVLTEEIKKFNQ
jgi:electron transfer flavoprotein alpha subunit